MGKKFTLAVLGEEFKEELPCFTNARKKLQKHIVQFGYTDSFEEYTTWLWKADILPVTSNQDFFGASIMEAIYCGVIPLFPNRLTYPELFNRKRNTHLFYNNEEDLLIKLERLVVNSPLEKTHFLKDISRQFDWSKIAEVYDRTFLKLSEL